MPHKSENAPENQILGAIIALKLISDNWQPKYVLGLDMDNLV